MLSNKINFSRKFMIFFNSFIRRLIKLVETINYYVCKKRINEIKLIIRENLLKNKNIKNKYKK